MSLLDIFTYKFYRYRIYIFLYLFMNRDDPDMKTAFNVQ